MHSDQLAPELAKGNPQAFEKLYDLFAARLYAYCLGQLRNTADAEDAVQNTMVRFVRYREKFRAVTSLDAYVFVCARNEVNRLRSRRKPGPTVPADEVQLVAREISGDEDRSDEERALLNRALLLLPPDQLEVISLKVWSGLTFVEIATVLEIPSNTAASRYRYAVEKLRGIMEGDNELERSGKTAAEVPASQAV
ncbi:MAG: RNA polymerase sigma factor [Candidatus Brocadiia bacterium]